MQAFPFRGAALGGARLPKRPRWGEPREIMAGLRRIVNSSRTCRDRRPRRGPEACTAPLAGAAGGIRLSPAAKPVASHPKKRRAQNSFCSAEKPAHAPRHSCPAARYPAPTGKRQAAASGESRAASDSQRAQIVPPGGENGMPTVGGPSKASRARSPEGRRLSGPSPLSCAHWDFLTMAVFRSHSPKKLARRAGMAIV